MSRPASAPDCRSRLRVSVLAALTVAAGGLLAGRSLLAWREGPPPARVGACGFGPTCRDAGCHSTFPVSDTPRIWDLHVELPAPEPLPPSYVPGRDYDLRLDIRDADTLPSVWGFQLAVLLDCPVPRSAGTIVPAHPSRTSLQESGGVTYLQHSCLCPSEDASCCGYVPEAVPGENGWSFRWTAPPRGSGQAIFTFAVNAANWDATPQDDRIYVAEVFMEEEACPPPVADLRARKAACEPTAPGEARVELSWTDVGAFGPSVVRACTDRATLAAARQTWPAGTACMPVDGARVTYYSVATACELGSEAH